MSLWLTSICSNSNYMCELMLKILACCWLRIFIWFDGNFLQFIRFLQMILFQKRRILAVILFLNDDDLLKQVNTFGHYKPNWLFGQRNDYANACITFDKKIELQKNGRRQIREWLFGKPHRSLKCMHFLCIDLAWPMPMMIFVVWRDMWAPINIEASGF